VGLTIAGIVAVLVVALLLMNRSTGTIGSNTPTSIGVVPSQTSLSIPTSTPLPTNTPTTTSTPLPTNTPSPTRTATNTPTLTPTFTATPPDFVTTYENFDDTKYDDSVDTGLWRIQQVSECEMAQKNGMMVVTGKGTNTACNLSVVQPFNVEISSLKVFETRIKAGTDHTDGFISQGLSFGTRQLEGKWWSVQCGIGGRYDGFEVQFDVTNWGLGAKNYVHRTIPAQHDTWYTIRTEVDPQSAKISCYVDNKLLGSFNPDKFPELAGLKSSQFERFIFTNFDVGTSGGTLYFDYVLVAAK
jgi:hypothetical protein